MKESANEFGRLLGSIATKSINIDANQDGKVTRAEIIGFLTSILFQALESFGDIPDAIKELKTDGSEARKSFLAGIKDTFDLANDEAEFLIEDWLTWLEEGISLGERTAAAFRKAA